MQKETIKVYKNMIKNRHSEAMNRDMIGYTVSDNSIRVRREDVLDYAKATVDNPDRYRKDRSPAPPFFPSRFLAPMYNSIVGHDNLKMNILKMVHWKQEAEWSLPVFIGDKLKVTSTVSGIYDVPAGEVLEITTSSFRGSDCLHKSVACFLVVQGDSSERKNFSAGDIKMRKIFTRSIETYDGQNQIYANISGDRNVIHTNRFFARMAGFPRTIMHGVCITAMVCNGLLEQLAEGDIGRLSGMSVHFASPVFPGEALTIAGYDSGKAGEIPFDVRNSTGKTVLKNGFFSFN